LFVALGLFVNKDVFDPATRRVWHFAAIGLSAALMLVASMTYPPLRAALGKPWFAWFGRLTYGMYLVHPFVLSGLATLVYLPQGIARSSNEAIAINYAAGLPLTVILATALWYAAERPVMRLKNRFAAIQTGHEGTASAR
jgi:peptidoglycan/LPS O-acetylase OafA/YrhL